MDQPDWVLDRAGVAVRRSYCGTHDWEIALKVKRGKLIIPLTITDYVERLGRLEAFEILSIDVQTWLDNLDLPWEHHDPADRTIVALASRFNCPLITSDRVIADFYPRTVW